MTAELQEQADQINGILDKLIATVQEERDRIYEERNMCVAVIYHMAIKLGYNCGLCQTPEFESGWQNCVMIDLPSGKQVSWHIKDEQVDWFAEGNELRGYTGEWDGHTTEEKYERVKRFR